VSAYKLRNTPETIVILPDYKIAAVWSGIYANAVQQDMERFFSISLPTILAERR